MQLINSQYQKTELDNGIRVVSEHMPHVRSVSIGAWIITGSRDEETGNNGISHYVEHMIFKGTENRTASEIAQSLESVGGHLNAFTSKELTCYYAHILDEHLEIAIDVIADILSNSVFDANEMEKEKRVVLEELNSIDETPEELIHDHFWTGLFPGHPLGFSVIGRREVIREMDRSAIIAYVDGNYTADRIVVVATGNVEHKNLTELIKQSFSSFNCGVTPAYQPIKNHKSGLNIVKNGAIQAHICMGTQAYKYCDKRKFSLLVLNTLLGSGMSSRLFQNIREKHGIAYSIYSFIDFLFDTGLFGVYIGTDKQKVDIAIDLIQKELAKLCKSPVSSTELARTKSQLKGNLMLGLESTSSRMNRLAKMEIYFNDYFTLDDTLSRIEAVSSAGILEIANDLFKLNNLFTTVLTPKTDSAEEREE